MVVKETRKPHEDQAYSISVSRKAIRRHMEAELGQKQTKMTEEDCVALKACLTAALEEYQAEERDVRKDQSVMEFHSKVKRRVATQSKLD